MDWTEQHVCEPYTIVKLKGGLWGLLGTEIEAIYSNSLEALKKEAEGLETIKYENQKQNDP